MNIDLSLSKLRDYLTAHPEKRGYVRAAKSYVNMWLREDNEQGRYRKKKSTGYKPTYDIAEYEHTSVLDEWDEFDDFDETDDPDCTDRPDDPDLPDSFDPSDDFDHTDDFGYLDEPDDPDRPTNSA